MTRQEWIENMADFSDLITFCEENGYQEDEARNIVSDYDLDSWIEDDIRNCDYGWRSLRDSLDDVPSGYEWYRCDGSFDYVGLTQDDFDDWKSDILSELDDDDFFDAEEEEEDGDAEAPDLFYFVDEPDPTVSYPTQSKPKWMCHATRGDDSIPGFETPGVDAMLGLLAGQTARTA